MIYNRLRDSLPGWLSRWIMHFEARIAEELRAFSQSLSANARVLDAGAGEAKHRPFFAKHRYTGVDLAIGDQRWDYSRIDAVADLEALPFRDSSFDAAINIVTACTTGTSLPATAFTSVMPIPGYWKTNSTNTTPPASHAICRAVTWRAGTIAFRSAYRVQMTRGLKPFRCAIST